jgi:formylglycine-generating enzyme required for sulfatase activity
MYYLNVHFINVQGENYKRNFGEILRTLGVKPVEPKKPSVPEKAEPVQAKLQKEEAPRPKNARTGRKWDSKELIIFVAFIALILVLVFGLPSLLTQRENTPVPTVTATTEFGQVSKTQEAMVATTVYLATQTITSISASAETPISTPTPLPTEITDDFGVEMVLIPDGEFTMGSGNDQQDVFLEAYYIDKFEVTNSRYMDCISAKACSYPTDTKLGDVDYFGNGEFKNYPVIRVTQELAKEYCSWRDARLPTGEEWEKAARGTDGRIYPWGDETDTYSRANGPGSEDGFELIAPIGSFPLGVSPYGVFDMAGNVSEYVSDFRQADWDSVEYPVYRGGSWIYRGPTETLEVTSWGLAYKWYVTYSDRGIRCAKDATP